MDLEFNDKLVSARAGWTQTVSQVRRGKDVDRKVDSEQVGHETRRSR